MERKAIFGFTLCFIFLFGEGMFGGSHRIQTFKNLMDALNSPARVKVVVHYAECRLVMDDEEVTRVPDAVGSLFLDTWEYFAKGAIRNEKAYLAASTSVLIHHSRYGYVLNYAKFRIEEDGNVEIVAQYLDPKSYEAVMDETFFCRIDDGKSHGGVNLFLDN